MQKLWCEEPEAEGVFGHDVFGVYGFWGVSDGVTQQWSIAVLYGVGHVVHCADDDDLLVLCGEGGDGGESHERDDDAS